MILSFHPCFDTDRQVILADQPLRPEHEEWIRHADAIILPQTCSKALYMQCVQSGAQVFPNYDKRFQYPGKLGQSALFEQLGCAHPSTKCWQSVSQFHRAHENEDAGPHPFPFLIKEDQSHEGEGVYPIVGKESLRRALEHLARKERSGQKGFVTQAFVPTDGGILRSVIIGSRLSSYWKRASKSRQPIVSLSKGAIVDHEWRPDLQREGRRAAAAFAKATKMNLAAIDLLFSSGDRDPEPLFLEVNYYFGRRGLGGTLAYYRLVHAAIGEWLEGKGLNPRAVRLV